MMKTKIPTKSQILKLYKHLMQYGKELQLTDKSYFQGRVRSEFNENRNEINSENINFYFKRGEALLRKERIL